MTARRRDAGHTLVEMLMVLAVLGTLAAITVGITMAMVRSTTADSSVAAVRGAVELARDRSIGERRDFRITFTAPNRIKVERVEVPSLDLTPVLETFLDNGLTYMKFDGLPDTPDGFGSTTAIYFGSTPTIEFTSDGSLLDSSGDPVNGTVMFGDGTNKESARALTIFGATGLINVWKWDGAKWTE